MLQYSLADVSESQCLQTNNMNMPACSWWWWHYGCTGKISKEPEYYEINDSNYKAELSSYYEDSDQAHVLSTVSHDSTLILVEAEVLLIILLLMAS